LKITQHSSFDDVLKLLSRYPTIKVFD
jgi:hypothetical protein